jgi:cytochrome c oxidase subunit 1
MSLAVVNAPAAPSEGAHHEEPDYIHSKSGVLSWVLTLDHKRIALLYLGTVIVTLFLGGVFALLLRIELLTPSNTIVDAMAYNRLFTLHGVMMVFFFMIPAIPGSFGNFFLPIMIGAHDVAFPKLNLLSYYLLVAGASLGLWGMIHGGADTGWTFYTPYSTMTPLTLLPILMGAFIGGFSSILTGLNFIVTIHTLRAQGMTWLRLPLFVWALYGTSVIQVLATPVLAMVLCLVAIEHYLGTGIFDPAKGGDPVLFQHLFWFYSHPAVYIMVLPAMGVISECVAAFTRKPVVGYKMIAISTFGIAMAGFLVWGHHLFTSGQSAVDAGIFGFLSMIIGVFTAIKVFNWVGSMYKAAINFKAPFLYVLGFLFFLVFGGMTGVAIATVSLDVHWQDTYFVIAHFHFVMAGSVIMAFLAALHYWFPKMFGKTYPEGWAMVAATLIILGFTVTFTPQFFLGNAGMPRRYYSYPEHFQWLHVISTFGSWLVALGFIIVAVYLVLALIYYPRCGNNPWGAPQYEWDLPSPPIEHNFPATPVITRDPYEYLGQEAEEHAT